MVNEMGKDRKGWSKEEKAATTIGEKIGGGGVVLMGGGRQLFIVDTFGHEKTLAFARAGGVEGSTGSTGSASRTGRTSGCGSMGL